MAAWSVTLDADDAAAHAAFATDRLWSGYAIADLDPPFRAYSTVAVARRGSDVAACLTLRHPAFVAVVPHGPYDGLVALLAHMELPRAAFLFARAEHLPAVKHHFDYVPTPMLRMAVNAGSFRPIEGVAQRLGPDDLADLLELYSGYDGNAFQPDQLALGVFYGIREGGRLLAAGGTQVASARSRIAAVGNIFTRPEARGHGLAAAVTSAVVADLLAGSCQDAILNVAVANEPAIRVYSRLGFRTHCQHFEGLATLRQ